MNGFKRKSQTIASLMSTSSNKAAMIFHQIHRTHIVKMLRKRNPNKSMRQCYKMYDRANRAGQEHAISQMLAQREVQAKVIISNDTEENSE